MVQKFDFTSTRLWKREFDKGKDVRIGIEARALTQEHRGIGRFTREIVNALMRVNRDNEYLLFTEKPLYNMLGPSAVNICVNQTVMPWTHISLFRRVKQLDLDLMLFPSSNCWLFPACPTLVCLLDLAPLIYKGMFFLDFKTSLFYRLNYLSIKRAAHRLVTISEYSRNDIEKYLGISRDRVDVVYLAASNVFCPLAGENDVLNELRVKYQVPDQFVLFVGGLDFRKNIERLLDAFVLLKKRRNLPHGLVLVGPSQKNMGTLYPSFNEKIRAHNIEQDVIMTGFVSDEDLVKFYNCADVFVFPSFMEGFGIPPLEAMACGCPVVASYATSIPEVVGDAAILVDPHDTESIVSGIERSLFDVNLREKLIRRGFQRVKLFTWDRAAQQLLDVFAKAVS